MPEDVSNEEYFVDPKSFFQVPIPTNWQVEQRSGYALLTAPEKAIIVYVLSVEAESGEAGITAAWRLVDPTFALKPEKVSTPPAATGVEELLQITYHTKSLQRKVSARGQLVDGRVYVDLVDGNATALSRRASQIQVIKSGLEITGIEDVDLNGVTAKPFDNEMQAELESNVGEAMKRADIPGADSRYCSVSHGPEKANGHACRAVDTPEVFR